MENLGLIIIVIVIGYLLGCISSAFIVAKVLGNIDIRKHGSGNAGATNVIRVLGAKAGAVTFIFDVLKGVAAAFAGGLVMGPVGALICGASSVIGHNWPVFLKFRGGKGIATTFGTILVIYPLAGLMLLLTAIVIIILTRYVSAASISAAAVFPIIVVTLRFELYLLIFSIFVSVIAILRHRTNIARLIRGKESKIGNRERNQ